MTDRELELQIRAWYRAEVPRADLAPPALRAGVLQIPGTVSTPVPISGSRWRLTALAAAALTAAIAGGLLLGIGRSPSPVPSASPSHVPSAAASTPSPSPTPTPFRPPSIPSLSGVGSILAQQANAQNTRSTVFLLDPVTSRRTLLGHMSATEFGPVADMQWSADRTRVMATSGRFGMRSLEAPTADAQRLTFLCCGPEKAESWSLSPSGTRAAGIDLSTPDELAIVVFDGPSNTSTTIRMPSGSNSGGVPVAWAPDETALFVVSCRPCSLGGEATPSPTVSHERIDIVPLDGSPIRSLVDATQVGIGPMAVSPDGADIAAVWEDCGLAFSNGFGCNDGQWSLMRISVADGSRTQLAAASTGIAGIWDQVMVDQEWSPDGSRVAFMDLGPGEGGPGPGLFVVNRDGSNLTQLLAGVVQGGAQWSPDGQWLLVTVFDAAKGQLEGWLVPANGAPAINLGPLQAPSW